MKTHAPLSAFTHRNLTSTLFCRLSRGAILVLTCALASACGGDKKKKNKKEEIPPPPACIEGNERNGPTSCGLNSEGVYTQTCNDGAWVETTTCTGTHVCTNETEQNGTTVCGRNAEGFYKQLCTDGAWAETTTCSGTDVCTNGDQQDSTTACGLNNDGVYLQNCTNGTWETSAACTATDVCTDTAEQDGSTACGKNAEGVYRQTCTDGNWLDTATCTGTHVCTNGLQQTGETVCGLNDEGFLMQDCTSGAWVDDTNNCTGTDECVTGGQQDGATVCGLNAEGVLVQNCPNGSWVEDTTNCTGTHVCTNGNQQNSTEICGLNSEGFKVQDCTGGAWVTDNATCTGTDECVTGGQQDGGTVCGLNAEGVLEQTCTTGEWVDKPAAVPENCTGTDVCTDDTQQTGTTACGLNDEGFIKQTCTNGAWENNGTCTGTDVCVDGSLQTGTTVCGLNGEAFFQQSCTDGAWVDSATCKRAEPNHELALDVCTNGNQQDSAETCGLNDEGFVTQTCTNGAWLTDDENDPENCSGAVDNCQYQPSPDYQQGDTVCGLNGEGFYQQVCVNQPPANWDNTATCLRAEPNEGVSIDVCTDGNQQTGATVCGLNNEGFLMQDCTSGAWVNNATCTGTDVCVNGTEQNGSTVCGLNAEGVLEQTCTNGQWVDKPAGVAENCTGTHVCTNGNEQTGTTACGLNNEGFYKQDCTSGAWVNNATCTGTDVCVDNTQQNGSTVCGFNAEGVYVQDCTDGAWVNNATCTGTDVCTNGNQQNGATVCGLNNEGVYVQDCSSGAWVDNATCTGTDVCVENTQQNGATACGLNAEGVFVQDCSSGAWVNSSNCTGTDVCVNSTQQNGGTVCGLNNEGVYVQDCTSGAWVDSSNCTGTDACVNGSQQNGATTCGVDIVAGVYVQDCTSGAWVDDTNNCTGPTSCTTNIKIDEVNYCGYNGQGYIKAYGSDRWEFVATSGQAITISVVGRDLSNFGFGYGTLGEDYVDLYQPVGASVVFDEQVYATSWVNNNGVWTSTGTETPYTFTPAVTGTYVVYAHGYLNDKGGYEINVQADGVDQPLTPLIINPTPSESPMDFTNLDPDDDWTDTNTGDLATDKAFETWEFYGNVDQNLKIDLAMVCPFPKDRSDLVEPFVYLFDSNGTLLASDDDSGSGNNARIYHTLTATGTYRIVATTYGLYHQGRNWRYGGNYSDLASTGCGGAGSWTLGNTGLGHYELTVEAKSTFDFVKTDITMNNPNAVKINAILLTDDNTLATLPTAYEDLDQAYIESLISALNTDFYTLYDSANWPGFELAAITKFYEPTYFFTPVPHGALAELGNTPAALQDHVNLIILDVDGSQTGIVGTTNLRGSILGARGATLVLEHDAGSGVFIHEMGHVTGIQHLAGSWPPPALTRTLADGTEFGYWTFDHSSPEHSYMSNWDSLSYDTGYVYKSWYLTKEATTMNSSTHGRLFAESLRTWLLDNNIIDSSAASTGYGGASTGDGDATDYWTWDASASGLQNNGAAAQAIYPVLAASSASTNGSAAVAWEGTSSNKIMLRYRNDNGTWEDTQMITTAASGNVAAKRIAMDDDGNAAVIWQDWSNPGIEVSYHGKDESAWGAGELVSTNAAGAKAKQASIAMNDNGEVVAIWVSRLSGSNFQIIVRERAVGGTWSAETTLYDGADVAAFPEVAFNADGDILAVWQEIIGGVFVAAGSYRNGDDDTWTSTISFSGGVNHAGFAQPAIDSSGNGLVYWREADTAMSGSTLASSGHVSVRSRSNAGVLGSITQLSTNGADSFNAAAEARTKNIALRDDGSGVATWWGFDGDDLRVYAAFMDTSGNWGSPEALSVAGQNANLPRLVLGDNGVVSISWQRSDGQYSRIQAKVYAPGSNAGPLAWSAATSLSDSGRLAFWSGIAFDGDDKFTAIWSRSDGANYKIETKQATVTYQP